ncbi:MAG: G5 domain-containing protein [Bacilli bacterium]|nr:G5 domain-containing protein [Bacilli bacterium]
MDNGSCIARKEGCMDTNAVNYDSTANIDNNSCHYEKMVVGKEKIKYKTKYKKNDKLEKDYKKVLQKGKAGEKEVTYKVTEDKNGNLITREEVAEKVITEPTTKIVEVGTKESSGIVQLLWVISLIVCFIYASKNKDSNLILNKIRPQKLLLRIIVYFLYIVLIIPTFIDIVIVIIEVIKKLTNKK